MEMKFLKEAIHNAPYGIFVADKLGNYLEVNQAACEITGYTEAELVGMNLLDLIPNEDKRKAQQNFNNLKNSSANITIDFNTKNGDRRTWKVKAVKLDENRYIGFTEDITEQKKLEEEIDYEKTRVEKYFELASVIIVVLDKQGNVQDINKKGCEILEYSRKNIIGKNWFDNFIPQSNIREVKSVHDKVVSGKTIHVEFYENPIVTSKGEVRIISWHNNTIIDDSGKISFIVSAGNDITEQKKAEEEIHKSQQILKTIINTIPVRVFWKNRDLKYLGCNKQFALDAGFNEPEEVIGKDDYSMGWKDQAELYRSADLQVIDSGIKKLLIEEPQTTPDGKTLWLMTSKTPLLDSNGDIAGIVGVYMDVTKRKQTEEELVESEARYRTLFQNSAVGIGYFKPDGTVISFNKRALKNLENPKQDYSGKSLHEVFPKNEADLYMKRIKAAISSDKPQEYIDEEKLPNSSNWFSSTYNKVVDDNGQVLGVQIAVIYITEKKNLEYEREVLESHLRNQQKLESIGTLASGIAHEINNPINGILNYGQVILDSDIEDDSIKGYASEIISETERVSNIVKNLLEFSRHHKEEHSYAKIDDIIVKTLSLVNTVFKHDQIEINLDMEEDLPKIKCRSQQIQQVIMNLITNARDALNLKYPGYDVNKKINIGCESYTLDDRRWLRLTVEDYGMGISKDIIDNIFDPFFTTKDKANGTGLGLSISYGIVKEHHGDISVESEEGKFTRFIVDLPCDNKWELE